MRVTSLSPGIAWKYESVMRVGISVVVVVETGIVVVGGGVPP